MKSQKRACPPIEIRNTQPSDFAGIGDLCRRVYADAPPWSEQQLASHISVFADGQFVAAIIETQQVVGMCSSLIVKWDEYEMNEDWRDFTDNGFFTNHDPTGRTLYAAEVMVDPSMQGCGLGKRLYQSRRELCRRLGLLRIRAGARLRGYHRHAHELSPEDYIKKVIVGELGDPTLSFQIRQGFRVIGVVHNYLRNDPESRGHAAVIEWINHKVATARDYRKRDPQFAKHREPKPA